MIRGPAQGVEPVGLTCHGLELHHAVGLSLRHFVLVLAEGSRPGRVAAPDGPPSLACQSMVYHQRGCLRLACQATVCHQLGYLRSGCQLTECQSTGCRLPAWPWPSLNLQPGLCFGQPPSRGREDRDCWSPPSRPIPPPTPRSRGLKSRCPLPRRLIVNWAQNLDAPPRS